MRKTLSQLFLTFMALTLSAVAYSQTLQLTYKIGEADAAITTVGAPGDLTTLLGGHDQAMTITELSVDGTLNDEDVKELRLMAGGTEDYSVPSTANGALTILDLSKAEFKQTGKRLPKSIFMNCPNIQKVNLENVTEISASAFENSGLTKVIIPQSVIKIGYRAFKDCSLLATLNFEEGSSDLIIDIEAFYQCSNMSLSEEGKLSDRIISIGARAFQGCGITQVVLPKNEKLTGIVREVEFNGTTTAELGAIGYGAFFGNSKLTQLTIPANISIISEVCFQDCNLQAIHFDDASQITEIQKNAFTNNQNLANLFTNEQFSSLKTIGEGAFQNCFNLTDADVKNLLTNVTRIERVTFRNCHAGLRNIDINSNIEFIGDGAFADNNFVKTVTVHSGKQIDARHYEGNNGIFYGLNPNDVQVVFADDAEANYMNYRKDITVNGVTYKNAFMDLLTKTMNEDDADYTVVPQHHADVKLKRTFKVGWNTLVLPFGSRADATKNAQCARVYQRALNTSVKEDDFMIAAYRGFNKNTNTFFFLKYANYDSDPLDEFEPLLIKMGAEDITSNQTYTFENVEVNYDADNQKEYTAKEVKAQMGKSEKGTYFDGNYDHNLNAAFQSCSYDRYYFTGTVYKRQATAEDGKDNGFINVGDFIIQNNNFVYCTNGTKYGLKGFRGYFKQLPTSQANPSKQNISICAMDDFGEVTAIDTIDGSMLHNTNSRIYNLNGQLMGTDASTLGKGIYVINGKKYVIK